MIGLDSRGEGLLDGVITITAGFITLIIFTFAVGIALDNYLYAVQDLGFSLSPPFSEAMGHVLSLAEAFYTIMAFSFLIFAVWFFKYIISKHRYTRYEEEEYEF